MPRNKIEVPASFSFSCSIPVRISDVNYGGHVGNDSILSIMHEARMQYLQHLGVSELDFGGTGLIMTDVSIEFKMESFYGDTIQVQVTAADFSRVAFNIYYQLSKPVEGQKRIIANGQTGMVCYNYAAKKVSSIPSHILARMNGHYIP